MSQNQFKVVEKEKKQYRKTGGGGRYNNTSSDQLHHSFTAAPTANAAGRGTSPTPPPSSNNCSFKKSSNGQGVQSRGNVGSVNTTSIDPKPAAAGVHLVENGNNVQSTIQAAAAVPKPADAWSQKSGQPIPKAPSSQSSSMTSNSTLPSTPSKGEGGKGFSLQFGSISPGFMNGMQVPARTSSAPPNLDEQQCDQVPPPSSRAAPAIPVPSTLKQQVPGKHATSGQPITQGTHTVSKVTKDVQVTSASSPTQPLHAQKPAVLPMPGISMPMPYQQHQPPVSIQFGGPNPHIQTQAALNNSFQLPMQIPLHIGNPPQVQQQVLVPGLQRHLMHNHTVSAQGQSFGFNPQLGPQISQQPGNVGMTLSPQYNLQQAGNVRSTRKIVKITHPETHEELRLDNRDVGSPPSPRSRWPPPSQPVPPYTVMRPSGYHPNSYSPCPPIFPAPNSLPLTSTQLAASSQGPRFKHCISHTPPTMPLFNQSTSNSFPNGKGAASMNVILESPSELARSVRNALPSVLSTSPIVTVKASVDSVTETSVNTKTIEKVESQVRFAVDSGIVKKDTDATVDDCSLQLKSDSECLKKPGVYAQTNMAVKKKETIMKVDSVTDLQKHPEKEHLQSSPQVDVQSGSIVLHDLGESLKVAAPAKSNISSVHGKDDSVFIESYVSNDAGSNAAPVVNLDAEKSAGEGQHAMNNVHLLQPTEKQVENESVGLQPSSALKSMEFVIKTEHCDELKKSDHKVAGFEISQGGSENVSKSMSDNVVAPASANFSEVKLRAVEIIENAWPTSSPGKTKNNKGKKKWRQLLQKADSLGTTSDLYKAYKGPEEKKENVVGEGVSRSNLKDLSDVGIENSVKKKNEKAKLEFEDWEDAADVSAQKLESSVKEECNGSHRSEGALVKKYSRDFLLTISEQCIDLPENFQIMPDIAPILFCLNANASHSERDFASSGRNIDKVSGAARNDRRGNGLMDPGRWSKPDSHFSGQDPGLDLGSNMLGFQSSPVLRNPRGHGPVQHASGILSGPMNSMGFQQIQRNNYGADRWQRATSFHQVLMPSPQSPSQVMHRADNKYEVGKVSDEEQAKQRRLKAILNKLTPQNFEKLFEQVKEVNIDNAVTLTGVISQIFDKALTEPTFCEMYANFCSRLSSELPDLSVDNEKITFKRLLLNKCQEEFERGEREEEEANKDDGEIKQTEEEREVKRLGARRRMLGNIRLIGELYNKRMLTERIMHECIKKLLGQYQNVDEENIEALCKLMNTIGEMIDHFKAKEHMDAYFDIMGQLSNNMKLSSRVRFMLRDSIDLRKNKWQQRMKVEGPKKIEEVHRDAAQERLGQAGRLSRGPSMNSGMRWGQPVEYGHRGSMVPFPSCQVGGFRGFSNQVRGYGGQDARMDERSTLDSRTLSMPLAQRFLGDEPTLGPQGGLARGMSCRGQSSVSISPSTDSTFHGDSRKMVSGSNGFSNTSGCGATVELNSIYTNKDVRIPGTSMNKSVLTSSLVARDVAAAAEIIASEKVWPEEHLTDMSLAAIKEYYSANDMKEVALCIKDLNAPKFYPAVISTWVTDAFERKDLERDMLAKLLINLTKPQDSIFSPQQLIEGFDSVLTNLEDTVTDAPKAPDFLGQIFSKLILQNVLTLKEVGTLLLKGGEEPGRLLEIGLAGNVIGSALEIIKSEKGESTLNEIRTSSGLQFKDFRPPDPLKSNKLEMFIM